MDITSTAPAPSISSLKFRLCSFPLWEGPSPSDYPGRESRFTFFTPSFQPEVRKGNVPWPWCLPSVQHQSEELSQLTAGLPLIPAPAPHSCWASQLCFSKYLPQISKPQPHSPQPCSGTASSQEIAHVQIQTCFSGWSPTDALSQTLGHRTYKITANMGKVSFSSAFWWQCISFH